LNSTSQKTHLASIEKSSPLINCLLRESHENKINSLHTLNEMQSRYVLQKVVQYNYHCEVRAQDHFQGNRMCENEVDEIMSGSYQKAGKIIRSLIPTIQRKREIGI
jgi:hypothetical protein